MYCVICYTLVQLIWFSSSSVFIVVEENLNWKCRINLQTKDRTQWDSRFACLNLEICRSMKSKTEMQRRLILTPFFIQPDSVFLKCRRLNSVGQWDVPQAGMKKITNPSLIYMNPFFVDYSPTCDRKNSWRYKQIQRCWGKWNVCGEKARLFRAYFKLRKYRVGSLETGYFFIIVSEIWEGDISPFFPPGFVQTYLKSLALPPGLCDQRTYAQICPCRKRRIELVNSLNWV